MMILFPFYRTRLQHVSFLLTPLCRPSLSRHRKLDKLKHAYQACMDEESTARESSRRLTNAIREVVTTGKSCGIYFAIGSPVNTSRTTTEVSRTQLVDAKVDLAGLRCLPALWASFEPIIRDLVSFA
jgi:hypothetical protein